jgi:hypothetical protein
LAAVLAATTQPPAPATPATETPAPASSAATESAAAEADILESSTPWWERITVTVDDKGKQQSCRYETNWSGAEVCDPEMASSIDAGVKSPSGVFSKVTFERRFSPGGQLDAGRLHPGDTLLGRQVMFLTIDARGAIESCKVVATSGDAPPDYGCEEARKDRFQAQASAGPAARQAFMTVLAYGHSEHLA